MRLVKTLVACAALVVGVSGPALAHAELPNRIKIVVPYPPGGPIDFTARLMAERLTDKWGRTVIVENLSGAASIIGTNEVVRAAKDGSVILIATAGLSVQPSVYDNLPYDPLKDLTPVTRLATSASLLAVNAEVPVHSVEELRTYLSNHEATPYGSQGVGSFSQLVMESFLAAIDEEALHVPYRGSSPALHALMSGETKLQFDIMMPMLSAIESGRLRPIAVTSSQRQPQLPDVPTIAEAGVPEAAITSWTGFFVPAGTPPTVVEKIDVTTREILAEKAIKEKLAAAGYQTLSESAADFDRFFKADISRFAEAAKIAKLAKKSADN